MSVSKKLIASVFPRYSLVLDQVNYNAKLGEWIKKNASVPQFAVRAPWTFWNSACSKAPA
jgi:hypothetical protein